MEENLMAVYIAETITSHLADDPNTSDFILRVDGADIAYVDVENNAVWLISIKEAKFVPA